MSTSKGISHVSRIDIDKVISSYKEVFQGNPALIKSALLSDKRSEFYKHYPNKFVQFISHETRLPIDIQCKMWIYNLLLNLKLVK